MKPLTLTVLLFIFKTIKQTNSVCTLSLKNDFGDPAPVYVRGGVLLAPNGKTGAILLRTSETVTAGCPGERRFIVLGKEATDVDFINLQCQSGTVFRAGRWSGEFRSVTCNAPPWFTVETMNATCHGGHTTYRVGYKVADQFYTLYEACFDVGSLRTAYVRHELAAASGHHQLGGKRPQFIDTDVFGKLPVSKLYTLKNQRRRLNEILGDGMDRRYIIDNQFLTRGHLAPRADFALKAEQRATFHYVNAAPQWMRGNAGDWAALEDAIRRRVSAMDSALVVYTGTHAVSTLPDLNGVHRELFLHVDVNNNGLIPVPLYYYKVIYNPKEATAVAFVSINSSYYNSTMIEQLIFCSDICAGNKNYSWLKWRPNDGTSSFCCDYEEFVKHIDCLPKLYVKGRFY